jgi:hypothetical protein
MFVLVPYVIYTARKYGKGAPIAGNQSNLNVPGQELMKVMFEVEHT